MDVNDEYQPGIERQIELIELFATKLFHSKQPTGPHKRLPQIPNRLL
jgi:hypothetical protein